MASDLEYASVLTDNSEGKLRNYCYSAGNQIFINSKLRNYVCNRELSSTCEE